MVNQCKPLFQWVGTYGDADADRILIQMTDEHDMDMIGQETAYIRELAPDKPFSLVAVKVNSWNQDLSPWSAPPVFGSEGFGDGAQATLDYLLNELIPKLRGSGAGASVSPASAPATKTFYIGGYSLAALFALWAVHRTDVFKGAAAASPSVWFPGFIDYMKSSPVRAEAVYLSLGDKEEKTRNKVMAQVGNAIREAAEMLQTAGCECTLEWNQGNHFKEPELRTAKAFAWLLNREQAEGSS